MVSQELLRRYTFFASLDEAQRKAIAQIADELHCPTGAKFFEEGESADALYLLLTGSVDLYFNLLTEQHKESPIGEVNPGEPFAISALIPPYILQHTARAGKTCHVLKINARALRALCDKDTPMGYILMRHVTEAAMERLHFTRIQLAAAQVRMPELVMA
ncbi:MAG: Crp/Fnr family transcriptional regulator [Anaerolineales bacterium]|nr:Crp/Fnr family transcriptional regulator [Anaerolineales bacterium]